MKSIRFNGTVEKRKTGCPVCGKSAGSSVFTMVKSYYLPSGNRITFRAGQVYEVSDADAEFLLSYKYNTSGGVKNVFEVVA